MSQWSWLELNAAGKVLSTNCIELTEEGTILWNGKATGGRWSYIAGSNIFCIEFSARGSQHARKHIFIQHSDSVASLLPASSPAYEAVSWDSTSYMHSNKNGIMIQKIAIPGSR